MYTKHFPVLCNEVTAHLVKTYNRPISALDCTVGCAGHIKNILKQTNVKTLVAVDRDHKAIEESTQVLSGICPSNTRIIHGEYSQQCQILASNNETFDAIIMDLGFSSLQLDDDSRGFSFKFRQSPLDMRMNQDDKVDAKTIINKYSRDGLIKLFKENEVPNPVHLSNVIINRRSKFPIVTVGDLLDTLSQCNIPNKRSLPAPTLVFQALRIQVNKELSNLQKCLSVIPSLLTNGGSFMAISFHSLEDRLIKMFIKTTPNLKQTHKKPIQASQQEISLNKRSRCAKLRIATKEHHTN